MKQHISTEEYFQAIGLLSLIKFYENKTNELYEVFNSTMEETENDSSIWNYSYEHDSALHMMEAYMQGNKIKVGGKEHKVNKTH